MSASDAEGVLRRAVATRVPAAVYTARHAGRRSRLGLRHDSRVFGIGLSRTGTTSLNQALGALLYRAAHFPAGSASRAEVLGFLQTRPQSTRLSVLKTHDAVTDIPVCVMFEALDAAYPGSKFVLTTRNKESWLDSCEAYWSSRIAAYIEAGGHRAQYILALHDELYGTRAFDRELFSAGYDNYHARVERHFAGRPGDLLRLDVTAGAGWESLCEFLGRPVPVSAFPRANARA